MKYTGKAQAKAKAEAKKHTAFKVKQAGKVCADKRYTGTPLHVEKKQALTEEELRQALKEGTAKAKELMNRAEAKDFRSAEAYIDYIRKVECMDFVTRTEEALYRVYVGTAHKVMKKWYAMKGEEDFLPWKNPHLLEDVTQTIACEGVRLLREDSFMFDEVWTDEEGRLHITDADTEGEEERTSDFIRSLYKVAHRHIDRQKIHYYAKWYNEDGTERTIIDDRSAEEKADFALLLQGMKADEVLTKTEWKMFVHIAEGRGRLSDTYLCYLLGMGAEVDFCTAQKLAQASAWKKGSLIFVHSAEDTCTFAEWQKKTDTERRQYIAFYADKQGLSRAKKQAHNKLVKTGYASAIYAVLGELRTEVSAQYQTSVNSSAVYAPVSKAHCTNFTTIFRAQKNVMPEEAEVIEYTITEQKQAKAKAKKAKKTEAQKALEKKVKQAQAKAKKQAQAEAKKQAKAKAQALAEAEAKKQAKAEAEAQKAKQAKQCAETAVRQFIEYKDGELFNAYCAEKYGKSTIVKRTKKQAQAKQAQTGRQTKQAYLAVNAEGHIIRTK